MGPISSTISGLAHTLAPAASITPGSPQHRQFHVLYGGAHLFSRSVVEKLGARARATMETFGADDALFATAMGASNLSVAERVRKKLQQSAIDALCIDFEDGYGPRPDDEEDAEAVRTAKELAAITTPAPTIGIRIKSFSSFQRAARTLKLFLDALGTPPASFTVTLPKVTRAAEVATLVSLLAESTIKIELMIETPAALLAPRALVDAGEGRVVAVHLGGYDLTAELGVSAGDQSLDHPYNQLARMMLKLQLPEIGISDGATTVLPTGDDPALVHKAWALHAANIRNAIKLGIWQGWDLHPAQLPARWGATFASFLDHREAMAKRLASFIQRSTQASRVGQVFDDAATARAVVLFFKRGLECGAFDDADLAPITRADLEQSFPEIAAR